MKTYLFPLLCFIAILFSTCEKETGDFDELSNLQLSSEKEFYNFNQSERRLSYKEKAGNFHFTVDSKVLERSDQKRKNVARQIVDVAQNFFSSKQVNDLLSTYGQPIWDEGIVCPTCTDATMYFPIFQQGNTNGLLAAIDDGNGVKFQVVPLELIKKGNQADNWVKAYLHFEGRKGIFHNPKK